MWGEGWVPRKLNLDGIELLGARNHADLSRADRPIVFVYGGRQSDNLYENIISNKKLHALVMNSEYIMGESAGSMVCDEYRRTNRDDKELTVKGLGILPNTIIEAHYTERSRHDLLRQEMKEVNAKYGIGIDSNTGLVVDTANYSKEYSVIGDGLVDFVTLDSLMK